jgi:thiol:disulfide interchange protein DsbA
MRLIQNLLFAFAVMGVSGGAIASPADPKNGAEYETLAQAQSTSAGAKVDVIEFFSYTCPHCKVFDPVLEAWVKKNADKISFKRVHVAFNGPDAALQRAYLSLEAMGLTDKVHPKVFVAIHEENKRVNSEEAVFDLVEKNGVERARFIGVYRSFGMQSAVNRAQALVGAYDISQWPMIAVGGRYLTSPYFAGRSNPSLATEAQQQQGALQIMDHLVAKAKAEKK